MNSRNIPRAQWPAFLDQFSRTHRAWLTTIESGATADSGASAADRQTAIAHPLRSVTPFVYNDLVVHIDIRFQDDDRSQEPLRITAPGTVRLDETTQGIAQTLEIIDNRGVATRLRFRAAPAVDMLDRVAPGEFSTWRGVSEGVERKASHVLTANDPED